MAVDWEPAAMDGWRFWGMVNRVSCGFQGSLGCLMMLPGWEIMVLFREKRLDGNYRSCCFGILVIKEFLRTVQKLKEFNGAIEF